jgi:hypothetical protein
VCIFSVSFEDGHSEHPISRILVSMNACVPKFMDASRHQYRILDFEILDDNYIVIVLRHLNRHPEGSEHDQLHML